MIQILQRFHISVPILKKLLTSHSACAIILKQCGYGGIGRRVWFGLRYDRVKNNRSHFCGNGFIMHTLTFFNQDFSGTS